jgi:hypothetical protein
MAFRIRLESVARLVVAATLAGGCGKRDRSKPPPTTAAGSASSTTAPPRAGDGKVEVHCTTTSYTDGTVRVQLDVVNNSSQTVHILGHPGMPYLLREGNKVVVLDGVNPPRPESDLSRADIPASRPLGPDDSVVAETQLLPFIPRDHYGREHAAVELPADVEVECRVAYGDSPIEGKRQAEMTLPELLAWEHWAVASPIRVTAPH